ncbi:archaeosortase/exosortase family protein [Verrucomicrobium spinosum]|uniref:archaeosortase/exosortase family protein n=1 Tax=Verrucomicrobium spinosum TaxID=2736 RepID=UPI0009464927|nr:archaeosortase/exosortase family protein [Verrucomicrobium spinosum]
MLPLFWLVFILPYAAGYGDFRRTIFKMLLNSWSDPTWQHGALALPMAVFLGWRRRKELESLPEQPSVWGLVVAFLAMAMYWAGYRGNFYYFATPAFSSSWRPSSCGSGDGGNFAFSCLPGSSWGLRGPICFWKTRWLQAPVPDGHGDGQGAELLLGGHGAGWHPSHLGGDATRLEGSWFRLNVDGPCSGLRSLFALIMVSALFATFASGRSGVRWCFLP